MMAQLQDVLFEVPRFDVKQLLQKDNDILLALLQKCSDYIQLVTGSLPTESAAHSLLTDCPEGKSPDDKLVIGFYTEEEVLVGLLDIIRDYPYQGDWWIGLLLLDPEFRGQGLGECIYASTEKWLKQYGAKKIYLGIVEQNQEAYRFWRKVGFEPVESQPSKTIGKADRIVITMVHGLES
jgi:GNAT superfamily N-acetyltransferase